MAAARPGEGDVIVAGEFNLDSAELALVTTAADRTAGSGSRLNLLGEPVAILRDHILVRPQRATVAMVGNGMVLDVRGETVLVTDRGSRASQRGRCPRSHARLSRRAD